jgi:ABC-type lipopolysaccharide export system ATPase subunit
MPEDLIKRRIDILVDKLDIGRYASRTCDKLSTGEKQRVAQLVAPMAGIEGSPVVRVDPGVVPKTVPAQAIARALKKLGVGVDDVNAEDIATIFVLKWPAK